MMRRGIRQLLEIQDGLEVVGEASSGEEALDLVAEREPDMIVMDVNMKGMDGIQTITALRERGVTACILMLTVSDQEEDVIAALRAGADGYLLKDVEPEELVRALVEAEHGQMIIAPQLTRILARALRNERLLSGEESPELTPRELEILRLIATGSANKLIARELGISEATVKVHVKNLLKKLGFRSRVEAAVWAVSNRVV